MNCRLWEERIALYQGGDLPARQMRKWNGTSPSARRASCWPAD